MSAFRSTVSLCTSMLTTFPSWGLWEKAAVSLLAGVPVLAKPATSTAWLAQEMVSAVIEAGILAWMARFDSVRLAERSARSSSTRRRGGIHRFGRDRRRDSAAQAVRKQNMRVNIEADSLEFRAAGAGRCAGFAGVRILRPRSRARDDHQGRAEVYGDSPRAGSGGQGAGGDRCDRRRHLKMVVVGDPANATGDHGAGGQHGAAQIGGRGNPPS